MIVALTDCPRIAVLVMGLAWLGCAGTSGCKREQAGPPLVVMHSKTGEKISVRVEVVRHAEDLARGLMFREHLDADAGMIFLYPEEHLRHFWMKNTYIPLDMVFIGDNRRIVGIVHQAEPLTTTRREVDAPSRFVLEVNGGFMRKHKIPSGSAVELLNIPGLADR
jgi:uncharacterized protein